MEPWGNLTKTHHKAQPPHEVSTSLFHCCLLSLDDITISFHYQKSPQITSKSVKLHLHNHFRGRLVKTLLILDSDYDYAGKAGQKHP